MEKYKGVNITPWKLAVSKNIAYFFYFYIFEHYDKKKNPESK